MELYIDEIRINVTKENTAVRLVTEEGSFLFANQTIKETADTIEKNYQVVKAYFEPRIGNEVVVADIKDVSLRIVLHYFYMYNLWRRLYKKEASRDLSFRKEDFEGTTTARCIRQFFKNKYPDRYTGMCMQVLKMSHQEFINYEENERRYAER
ncbi:hypothetical protein C8P68_106245 [Mucilaginibacter yixingensis]|uniref:Uncharacterized protein n=1 Tax=Mucilaginibacter yixingensis TaxID=1295612 RepID=A0A2T5J7A5_9SPHI|nr:hypothetical protein [Mucilaginibacter yixingensis]PTQ95030.1 hypothetical protein C8P68_106245 [Mucilaginibacter yixingensis]